MDSFEEGGALRKEGLRIGVVGLGKMGLVHAGVLSVLSGVEVVALCEKSGWLRRFLKVMFGEACVVDDVGKLCGLGLDAVYVTTPIPTHYSVVKTLCKEKIAPNLFVEKTLAQDYREAEELCKLGEGLGGVNMVGYLRRFGVTYRKAKELLSEEAVGNVASFQACAYSSDFSGSKDALKEASSRGGVLRDLGCHAVDLALWFFGDLQVDSSKVSSGNGGSGESIHFTGGNPEGLKATFDVSWCKEGYRTAEVWFHITGSKGIIEVNDDSVELRLNSGESSTWYRHDLQDKVAFWLGLPEYYREDLHFIKSLWKDLEARPNFHDASKVDQIIERVLKETGENE